MDKLKQFVRGEINYITPTIVEELKKYDSIQVDSIVYDAKQIIEKIEQQGCLHCRALQAEVVSLRYQLKQLQTPPAPHFETLLRKFILENYKKTKARQYSRTQLFKDVNIYLQKYNLRIMYNTDKMWTFLIECVIGDVNRNYRKLKIRKL